MSADIGADIATYLQAQGLVVWKNVVPANNTIFLDELPDLPADCVGIWINNGKRPEHFCGADLGVLEYPIADIIVRNASKATARDRAETIRQLFSLSANLGNEYVAEMAAGSYPVYLGRDDSNRHKFSVSIELTVER